MSDIIKFPSSDPSQKTLPKTPLISLMKARSFVDYNAQFKDPNRALWDSTRDEEADVRAENIGNIQRAIDFLNRDNAEVPFKNRLIIAHKMPDGEIKQWSKSVFCQFYSAEYFYYRYFIQNSKNVYIAKLWLESSHRRRYNSYDEYLKG